MKILHALIKAGSKKRVFIHSCRAGCQPKVSIARSNAWWLDWLWLLWDRDCWDKVSIHLLKYASWCY